ncbi:MAG: ABC transporter ATP-binding protein [Pirellulales bacterium]|nr:ABC transporter ATP-binding protein [Pirellulales bacterium]
MSNPLSIAASQFLREREESERPPRRTDQERNRPAGSTSRASLRRGELPSVANPKALMTARGLKKSYRKGPIQIPVLRGIDLDIRSGEFLAIVGQSGCGKSTLLHVLGTLDAPDSGEVHFEGNRIDNLPAAGRDILRNRHFGMIFQFYHLLPELTTLENVLAPWMIAEGVWTFLRHRRLRRRQASELLEMVGLTHRAKHKPRELSGGEMQRAAIARSLIAGPKLLLADEPTGNLDKETGRQIMDLLGRLNRERGLTIIMVTHDDSIAALADRTVRLVDGRVKEY